MSEHVVKFWTKTGGPITIKQEAEGSRYAALRAIPMLAWIGYAEFLYVQVGEGMVKTFLSRDFSVGELRWAFEQYHAERAREEERRQRSAVIWGLTRRALIFGAVFAAGAFTYYLWSRR